MLVISDGGEPHLNVLSAERANIDHQKSKTGVSAPQQQRTNVLHFFLKKRAKRLSYLNVETEPRIKWCGGGDPCINV